MEAAVNNKRWRRGGVEPGIEELLTDPIVGLVLQRDRITLDDVWAVIYKARRERRVRPA